LDESNGITATAMIPMIVMETSISTRVKPLAAILFKPASPV
jgi:hypothetical protein